MLIFRKNFFTTPAQKRDSNEETNMQYIVFLYMTSDSGGKAVNISSTNSISNLALSAHLTSKNCESKDYVV